MALCDVDKNHGARIFKKYSKAKQFTNYRRMLDEMNGGANHSQRGSISASSECARIAMRKHTARSRHEHRAIAPHGSARRNVFRVHLLRFLNECALDFIN